MGKTSTRIITEPTINLDDVVVMTPGDARAALIEFCNTNGFDAAVQTSAFHLFTLAVATPGKPVKVPTNISVGHTRNVHDCMEAITSSPVASAMAGVAFDAAPGTHFLHTMRHDACQLTNLCTNARN